MAIVLQVVPALDAGGVERTTLEVAEALARAGHTALVASAGGRLEPDLASAGGELLRLNLTTKNPLQIRANADRLAAIAQQRQVDLIHARSRAPGWSAYWAARKMNLPFVTTYHGIYKNDWPGKRTYNSVMAKGDIVIANSHFTRAHVIVEHELDPERVVAIPRGVDLKAFDPSAIDRARVAAQRQAWNIGPRSGLVLLLPARLTRWKGQLVAIEAVRRIAPRRPEALTLILAGDSQGRDAYVRELRDMIETLNLEANVKIVGHVADMPAAYAAADAVLAPSIEPEAFGRTAAEGQAMGLPVIATDIGGFTETIAPEQTGLLVPAANAPALAAAIERIIDSGPEWRKRMGEAGQARARSLYAAAALQKATLAVYDRLLGDRR